MYYRYAVPAPTLPPTLPIVRVAIERSAQAWAEADFRWPAMVQVLTTLRTARRKSVRIVDAACGDGELLIQAAWRARALGFVAIEGRGVDRDVTRVQRARSHARSVRDPAIALSFETCDAATVLREEAAFPADIVLYAANDRDPVDALAIAAGRVALRFGGARAA